MDNDGKLPSPEEARKVDVDLQQSKHCSEIAGKSSGHADLQHSGIEKRDEETGDEIHQCTSPDQQREDHVSGSPMESHQVHTRISDSRLSRSQRAESKRKMLHGDSQTIKSVPDPSGGIYDEPVGEKNRIRRQGGRTVRSTRCKDTDVRLWGKVVRERRCDSSGKKGASRESEVYSTAAKRTKSILDGRKEKHDETRRGALSGAVEHAIVSDDTLLIDKSSTSYAWRREHGATDDKGSTRDHRSSLRGVNDAKVELVPNFKAFRRKENLMAALSGSVVVAYDPTPYVEMVNVKAYQRALDEERRRESMADQLFQIDAKKFSGTGKQAKAAQELMAHLIP